MNREQFDKTRREFDQLRTEEKAVFIVEALASTVARGVEQLSEVVAQELDRIFKNRESTTAGSAASEKPNGTGHHETPPM